MIDMTEATGDYVDDFIKPLIDLGMRPKGDIPALAEALAEDAPGATAHQLGRAVVALRKSWPYAASFPSIKACLEAIRAAPTSERVAAPKQAPVERPRDPWEVPIVRWALRFLNEYDAVGDAARAALDRQYPGRHERAGQILEIYGVER